MTTVSGSVREDYLNRPLTPIDPPFDVEEYRQRLSRLRESMAAARVDCVYLTAPESIYYLSGYACEWYQASSPRPWWPASGIAVHVDHDEFIHLEHTQEATLVGLTSVSRDVRLTDAEGPAQQEFVVGELAAEGWLRGSIGLELGAYRPARLASESFQALVEAAGGHVVDATEMVRSLRRLKSPAERRHIREAQRIADIGMAAARDAIGVGVTELEVYGAMIHAMARAGGEVSAIPPPVLSGPRASTVHGLAGRRRIQSGELVSIDLCGVYQRYHANLARTFAIGEPTASVRRSMEAAYAASAVFDAALHPGALVDDVLLSVAEHYRSAGILDDAWWVGGYELGASFPPDWVGQFLYSLGDDHGDEAFRPGDVVNFEANFYLPEAAGIVLAISTAVVDESSGGLICTTPSDVVVIDP